MGGWTTGGVDCMVGVTGSGKTTFARQMQARDVLALKTLPVTMDLESAADWVGVPHASGPDEVLEELYVHGRAPKIWTPRSEQERAKFFKTVSHWGRASILIDGVPMICNDHRFEEDFRMALHRHRHGRLGPTTYYLVAQRFSLLHRHVYAAVRTVYVYRQAPGVDARRVEQEFGILQAVSTALGRGKHVPVSLGFPEETEKRGDPGGRRSPDPTPETDGAGRGKGQ